MSEKVFSTSIIDFNPKRMNLEQLTENGIPTKLADQFGDFRQYPLNIAAQLADGAVWYSPDKPWHFKQTLLDSERFLELTEAETLILSGSGMSAYKYQEGIGIEESDEKALGKAEELVRQQLIDNKWVLGICFGGQIAIKAVGGKIGRLPENGRGVTVTESGWLDHELTDVGREDEIFGQLTSPFYAPHLHNDFVSELPAVGTQVSHSNQVITVVRSEVLAVRHGFLGQNGLTNLDTQYIQASLIEFDNSARLYQIQPHPEMATPEKANFLVRQNPWIANPDEMAQDYYDQALQVPTNADFSVARVITDFSSEARKHREQVLALNFVTSTISQDPQQFIDLWLR